MGGQAAPVQTIRPWILGASGVFAVIQSATAWSMISSECARLATFG